MRTPAPFHPAHPALPESVRSAVEAAREKHGQDIVVLDLRGLGAFTDYFLICSAGGARQIGAIQDAIEDALARRHIRAAHREGGKSEEWVLLDYGHFVAHIFSARARLYYDLERLWRDAQRTDCSDGLPAARREKRAGDE